MTLGGNILRTVTPPELHMVQGRVHQYKLFYELLTLSFMHYGTQALLPKRTGKPRNEEKVAELTAILRKSLEVMENYFLKDKKFIAGSEISIADLEFLGEVTQYWIADIDIYKGRPNIERWVEECQKVLAPHFDQLYQFIYEMRKAKTLATTLDL